MSAGGRKVDCVSGLSLGDSLAVETYFLHLVEEPDQSGDSGQSDQTDDANKHQNPHDLVGLGGVVLTVVLQVLGI